MGSLRVLNRLLLESNIHLTTTQLEKLFTFHLFLEEKNREQNLIASASFAEIVRKHYVDSLIISDILNNYNINLRGFLDLGSGGGFPGIPLAILMSSISSSSSSSSSEASSPASPALASPAASSAASSVNPSFLLEKRKLRCSFLTEAVEILDLPNVHVLMAAMRADVDLRVASQIVSHNGFKFPCIVARAFGSILQLLHLCERHLSPAGMVICMKGPNCDQELKACFADTRCMANYTLVCDHAYQLPLPKNPADDQRRLLVWKKVCRLY